MEMYGLLETVSHEVIMTALQSCVSALTSEEGMSKTMINLSNRI
jgi:hypothetical protein